VFLTDVHAHLCDAAFDTDLDAVLERAHAAGVAAVVAVGETLADARKNLELAARYSGTVLPAAGLYPVHLDRPQADALEALVRESRRELAAIGEVGLDHWKVQDEAGREIQREIFARFVALSIELDLPLNVHSRSASRDAVALLLARGARRVVLHAFDGKVRTALPAVEAGYYFSIPPSIVRSPQKQKLAKHLSLSCLLLETDSPVLGPAAGERNEPANLTVALAAVAGIKDVSVEEVAESVTENARRLFGITRP
jgi:TatD DNase family protein